MAAKKQLPLSMKNSQVNSLPGLFRGSAFAAIILSFALSASTSYASGHGGGEEKAEGGHEEASSEHGEGHGEKKKQGNFTTEDLDQMKQSMLLDYLSNDNYQSSEYATYYFEQKGEEGIKPLLAYMKSNEDNLKKVSAIIYTLGRVGPKAARAVPVLTKYLSHENFDIRKTTISALGKIGKASDPAVPDIARYLDSDDAWMRQLALRSLKDIKTPQSISIATQYENKLKLEEERKAKELLDNDKTLKTSAPKPAEAKTPEKPTEEKHADKPAEEKKDH